MCRHDGLKAPTDGMVKGLQLDVLQPLGSGMNDGKFLMGIRIGVPVTGKVFATSQDTVVMEACHRGCTHKTDFLGFRPKCPISNDGVGRVGMNIQNGSHIHVDSDRP